MTDFMIDVSDMNLDDLGLDDMPDFDSIMAAPAESLNCRYVKPKIKAIRSTLIKYENAEKMAKEIGECRERTFALLSGSFIFGDFIEALVVEQNFSVKRMVISTLSMSDANIESLRNLIVGDYVHQLDLIVSAYFYSHERNGLIKMIYDRLDIDDKLQLTAASTHTKVCTIETECGRNIVIHGSANLRSSGCSEQICIEDNKELIDFYMQELINPNIEHFSTIKKPNRSRGFI